MSDAGGATPTQPYGQPAAPPPEEGGEGFASRIAFAQRAGGAIAPLLTVLLAFVMGGLVVLVTTGKNPINTYRAIFDGSGLIWFFQIPWDTGSDAAFNLQQTLIYATPLIFAALGGMFSERSGVVNIGLEGMMLTGAFFGILAADKLDSWELGLLVAILSGGAMALLHAVWSIHFRADQIISGFAVNVLAVGLTGYLFIDIYGQEGTPSDIPSIPNVHLAFLDGVGFFGDIFGNLNLMIWIALILVPSSWFVLFRTPLGLRIRAVGEHPRAADTVGIDVYKIRYGAVVASGMLAAAGGAFLSIGFLGSFSEGMTAGRGYIALAAVIFGNWRPFGAAAACLLFGFSSALAQRLPEYSDSAAVLFSALPYVLTLIAVAGVIGRSIPPAADGKPYRKQ